MSALDVGLTDEGKAAFDAATNNKVKKQMSDGIGRKKKEEL